MISTTIHRVRACTPLKQLLTNLPSLTQCLPLCFITAQGNRPPAAFLDELTQAIRGGVTMIQLREKTPDTGHIIKAAKLIQQHLSTHAPHIPLVLNDDPYLARYLDCHVHVGQEDIDVETTRRIIGPGKIVGLSIESFEQLDIANQSHAPSYVTASAVFNSNSKPDTKMQFGLTGLRHFVAQSRHPVTAIGGINLKTIDDVAQTGVSGVAVIGAIARAENPTDAASRLRQAIMTQQVFIQEASHVD